MSNTAPSTFSCEARHIVIRTLCARMAGLLLSDPAVHRLIHSDPRSGVMSLDLAFRVHSAFGPEGIPEDMEWVAYNPERMYRRPDGSYDTRFRITCTLRGVHGGRATATLHWNFDTDPGCPMQFTVVDGEEMVDGGSPRRIEIRG